MFTTTDRHTAVEHCHLGRLRFSLMLRRALFNFRSRADSGTARWRNCKQTDVHGLMATYSQWLQDVMHNERCLINIEIYIIRRIYMHANNRNMHMQNKHTNWYLGMHRSYVADQIYDVVLARTVTQVTCVP